MKNLIRIKILFIYSLHILLLSTSCSSAFDCQNQLSTEFSEIEEYLDSLNVGAYELDNCTSRSGNIKQFGHTATNSKGMFYIDSCKFESLTITTFDFTLKAAGQTQAIKFNCYQFNDENELLTFDEFKNGMSRSMNQSKEIHTFFKKNNKWFLYYEGFP